MAWLLWEKDAEGISGNIPEDAEHSKQRQKYPQILRPYQIHRQAAAANRYHYKRYKKESDKQCESGQQSVIVERR